MIKFENFKLSKSLGKMNKGEGLGVSVVCYCEIISAEYKKNKEGKVIKSANGNSVISLNAKVENEIIKDDGGTIKIPTFLKMDYYETEFSPKLAEIKPTDKLQKFAKLSYNTGGLPAEGRTTTFGHFKIDNYTSQDGSPRNNIHIMGGNVNKANKVDGTYWIDSFNGHKDVFVLDKCINVSVKGVFESITDTESFLNKNYNKKNKTLKFNMFYLENDKDDKYDLKLPCVLENIEEERVMKFITFIKNNQNTAIGLKGKVKSYPIYETKEEKEISSEFGEYSYGNEPLGYEAFLMIDFDADANNWYIFKSTNTGKVVCSSVNKEEEEKEEEFPDFGDEF